MKISWGWLLLFWIFFFNNGCQWSGFFFFSLNSCKGSCFVLVCKSLILWLFLTVHGFKRLSLEPEISPIPLLIIGYSLKLSAICWLWFVSETMVTWVSLKHCLLIHISIWKMIIYFVWACLLIVILVVIALGISTLFK